MAPRPDIATDPMLPVPYRVARSWPEGGDTFTLEMLPRAGGSAPQFAPGQFNMLYCFGVGEVPISISGVGEGGALLHTVRAVGRVTSALRRLDADATVGVRGPFGTPWPGDGAEGRDVVVVAGGIGLAPLRPLVRLLLARRDRYRRIALLYGARTPDELLFAAELRSWSESGDLEIAITVDRSDEGWQGRVGVVTTLIREAIFDERITSAFLCGPEAMMRFAVRELLQRGVAESEVYLSLERNMKCAVGHCGRCQFGSHFVCRDGPVLPYQRVRRLLALREV